MSKQVKKPAEQTPTKIKNVTLLPSVFATDPNKKMLGSTLDVMTSKGQLLPFKETYGLRNAANKVEEFFKVEDDQSRRESQGNNMLVVRDTEGNYSGKVSYYDIENYFAIRGLPLKDGVTLDKNINVLDLPIDPIKLTDYNMYYWLANDLPACRIHLNPASGGGNKFSIASDLIGLPFATVKDDLTGKSLELQNGMALFFTGNVDADYKTSTDVDNNLDDPTGPKIFYVYGVGSSIDLFAKTDIEYRVPGITKEKQPWDEYGKILEYPETSWDNKVWDGSRMVAVTPEYVVQEKYSANTNHWQAIDRWHHISTIRAVAKFLGVNIEDFVSSADKAKRPIISFDRTVKLYNWPIGRVSDVNSILRNSKEFYQGRTTIQDQFGYAIKNGDRVVFEGTSNIWQVAGLPSSASFTQVDTAVAGDGVIIITPGISFHYQAIYKNNSWQLAQNKTEKNQTPKFEFYLDNGTHIESLNEINYSGGIILGFKTGDVYDPVLEKYVDSNFIESEVAQTLSSPNQLKFESDIDLEFSYSDPDTNDEVRITGPYGYKAGSDIQPFYKSRRGLDFTKQMQDLLFVDNDIEAWSAEFTPMAAGFDTIHVFYDSVDNYKFYFDVEGYGLIQVSSKTSSGNFEEILPLVSGGLFKIICHDLPEPLTFYKASLINNVTSPETITSDYITNNGIQNGTIEIDLSPSIEVSGSIINNELSVDDTKLLWTTSSDTYKIAYVKPAQKWNFLQSVFVKDLTYPLYNGYDYTVTDITLEDGSISYYKQITDSGKLTKKSNVYDKVCVNSVLSEPSSRTAPLALTTNPLNEKISSLSYYGLYQHATTQKANSTNIKKFIESDVDISSPTFLMGGGTIIKHSDPLSKFAVTATNLPYEFSDIIIKQGKHYDSFIGKLKTELTNILNSVDHNNYSSLDILTLAINRIYIVNASDDLFWSHSNMIGWGEQANNYRDADVVVGSSLKFNLANSSYSFDNISHRTGKESLLHISYNGKLLLRGYDYWLNSTDGFYTEIEFRSFYNGKTVNIAQWYTTFRSLIPASLAKMGLTSVYKPEIYADTSYNTTKYFLIRHDGTRYFLEDGVDTLTGDPINPLEFYLYEYEKAVWSSIAYDVENNSQREILENCPGYFRKKSYTYEQSRATIDNEVRQWMLDSNIFIMENENYDNTDGFTLKYQIGSGDGETVIGSWRAVYKFMYDTDRPHSHPWEMLGYTLKPSWWDTHYSWTDPTKRLALKKALRLGKISNPAAATVVNPSFARNIAIDYSDPNGLEDFPVTNSGELISPLALAAYLSSQSILLAISTFDASANWEAGNVGPYEQVFLNSQRGLAADVRAKYLLAPAQFISLNWVPGQTVKNSWNHKLDRTTNFWQQGTINHDYHRKTVNGELVYTGGIESLYSEFCLLNNKDYKAEVIDKFNNLAVNKEFMLGGFSNKNNVRIQSTSVSRQKNILFIPEENYQVRTVKHYPHKELFYSGMRIIWDGSSYSINGFATEFGFFPCYTPKSNSQTAAREIGNATIKEKLEYTKNISYIGYGKLKSSRQEVYDLIIGYGKYLEDQGFVYEEPESGDIRNWQLSAKQFIFWSNDSLAPGNYIDLNPCADFIKIATQLGQLENLEGTNENIGQCVDRFANPLFSKDLLVSRDSDFTIIKTKKEGSGIYGIKMSFVNYETVVHLDNTSIFGDTYFDPAQATTKRSFVVGGKKSINWTGAYDVPGYVLANNTLIPNLDTMAEVGRNLLDVESVVFDPVIAEASRDQFGLTRNPELRQLFLDESNETLFKNAITFNKGTSQVFDSLNPLTHQDGSSTTAYEEYMVRLGEFGNTKNIEYYEFELQSEDIKNDTQIIKFTDSIGSDTNVVYVTHSSSRWVDKPYSKNLEFQLKSNITETTVQVPKKTGPVIEGDTDLNLGSLIDLPNRYNEFVDLWSIDHHNAEQSYKVDDKVRQGGQLYQATETVPAGTWTSVSDKFTAINEPYLPNIYVNNYNKPNPDLTNSGPSIFTPGTWQVLQTTDRKLSIVETCPGFDDVSKARITTSSAHKVEPGDYVLIINCKTDNSSVDGIWQVDSIDKINPAQFYINTRITEKITTGKVFTFKPVRFKNTNELAAATADNGYDWTAKNSNESTATPSGFDSRYPIAIVDDGLNNSSLLSYDYGNYKVYQVENLDIPVTGNTVVKTETLTVDTSDIEHLIVYDYDANKTIAKLELFNPATLDIPQVFKNDIDVIGRVDPAKYNRTTDSFKSIYTSLGWYEEYVGRRWWNTSSVQLADYNSGDDQDKAEYWGKINSDPVLEIYEWTKSTVHPSKWNDLVKNKTVVFGQIATGEVYIDSSLGVENYHWVEEEDYLSGKTYTVYYFWVKNKKSIATESKWARTYTTDQLSRVLLNPSAAGLAWWSPISANTIIVKGIKPYLNNTSTVVQIKKKTKGEEKHQQWLFVSEGNNVETIPEWLHVRLRDSLSAHLFYQDTATYTVYSQTASYNRGDIVKYNNNFYLCRIYMSGSFNNIIRPAGPFNINEWYMLTAVTEISPGKIGVYKEKNVPEITNLHRFNRLGNVVRPYVQTWFSDLKEARRTFIRRLNEILLNVDMSEVPSWPNTILNNTNYTEGSQSIDVTKYWTRADFRSEKYQSTRAIAAVLNNISELYTQNYSVGDYIKINIDFKNYVIYEKVTDGGFNVVYRKNGAIQFIEEFEIYGWDSTIWDSNNISWDYDTNILFNAIINSLRTEIFLGKYLKNYSLIMCAMFRYVLSEQVNVDWLAKSSTVEPVNLIAQTLKNSDYLMRDEVSALINFYGSVKSYRDKIRSGTINKITLDNVRVNIYENLRYEDITDADVVSGETTADISIRITGEEIPQ